MKLIYWHKTGPLIKYSAHGVLHIEDLNPSCHLQWRVGRRALLGIAWRAAIAAITPRAGVTVPCWEWMPRAWRGSGHRFLHLGPFRFWVYWPY